MKAMSHQRRQLLKMAAVTIAAAAMPEAASAAPSLLQERPIPRSGERLPVVGIGTWQTFDVGPKAPERAELADVLRGFVAHGGRVLDSSPMYGQAERVVGDLSA